MNQLLHDVSWVVPYRTEFLTSIFKTLTWLGYPTFVMLLLALAYWLWNKSAATRIISLVILSTLLNVFLKDYFQNPRPDAIYHLDPGVGDSFGMPSGHAQIAVVLWYGLAFEIQKRWAWAMATILVAGIAFSRIYLGIHDLEDIVSGLAIGFVSLYLYRVLLRPKYLVVRSQPVWYYLAALVVLQVALYRTWPEPAHTLNALALIATLFGWLLGNHIQGLNVGFNVKPRVWAIALVVVIGIAGLAGFTSVLKPIMSSLSESTASYTMTFAVGIYMTLIAPAIFKLVRLSNNY